MKNLLTPSRTIAVVLLLGWWGCAPAQSLGTPVAEVLLGQPLAMTVPARFASRDAGDECVHADVFYGERRVPDGHVRAIVTGPDQQRRVRIEAEAPIDEPIVTVSLRAGCSNTITRNYTLLPEYPTESRLAAIEARNLAAAAVPLRLATHAAPAAAPAPVVRRSAPRPAVLAQAGDAKPQRAARPGRGSAHAPAPAASPRLRLEPIDLDPQAVLRVSSSLAEPQGDASRRATAALLWQAINADPQELLRTGAMLQKLEADLAQMRRTNSQTRAELVALRQRLDQSGSGPAQWLQFLALLVAAAAAAAGVLWWRTRQLPLASGPWYAGGADAGAAEAAVAPESVAGEGGSEALAVPARQAPGLAVAARAPLAPMATVRPAPATIDFELPPRQPAAARSAAERALRVETLIATFEEVEFLSSLGLQADAMDVLKSYLQDCAHPAPLAFFELMRLCDPVEDAAALATARRRYGQAFGVEPPRLEQVTASLGLESLTPLSERIAAAWRTGEARALIEETLFTVPAEGAPLTVQAGRDLLCLHQLATAMEKQALAAPLAQDGEGHPLAPWAHADDAGAAHALAQAAADAHGGHRFALDVDLGAAPPPLPEPEPLPDTALDPLLAEFQAAAERDRAERERAARRAAEEDAFSAAVASERIPVSRY